VVNEQTYEKIAVSLCVLLCIILDFFTLKAYLISLVFLFCNIHMQTGYYKKSISYLVANFPSFNVTNTVRISQHLSNHKNKKVNFFLDAMYIISS